MYKTKLAELLPDSFSAEGLREIEALVESVVQERVEEAVNGIESRVAGFLKLKLNALKESANRQVMNSNRNAKATKIYESIKLLVASDIDTEDIDSVSTFYEKAENDQNKTISSLNAKLKEALQANTILEGKLETEKSKSANLKRKTLLPFKSSEGAVVINRECVVTEESQKEEAPENEFLTEEVISLK